MEGWGFEGFYSRGCLLGLQGLIKPFMRRVGSGRTISSAVAELDGVHEERHRFDLGQIYL